MNYKEENKVYPKNALYFINFDIYDFYDLSFEDPEVECVNAIKVWPDIEEFNIVETDIGISNEGTILTGCKISVLIKFSEKITYSAKFKEKPVHIIYNEYYKSKSIVIPKEINGIDIEALVRARRVNITPYIEYSYVKKVTNKKIYKSMSVLIDLKVC
ncbi:MAG: hypothetical protein ACRCYC_01925 [Paraclostridium sp.]|uniref:hypothetical protein n=1 Tax=Paraclostridium sp. TaxID=2023273 RepID=UPI003F304CFE